MAVKKHKSIALVWGRKELVVYQLRKALQNRSFAQIRHFREFEILNHC